MFGPTVLVFSLLYLLLPTMQVVVPSEEVSVSVGVAVMNERSLGSDDLWGSADACLVAPEHLEVAECFDSENELDERLAEVLADGASALAACTGTIRLYDGANYGTPMVAVVAGSSTWVNLSTYSFDNKTSSFKIGACDARLAMNANGGGSWYPSGSTQAYDEVASMSSTWNNAISSVKSA